MNTEKEELLNSTIEKFLAIGFCELDADELDSLADDRMMGFGTTIDEKIESIAGLRELIDRQRIQGEGLVMRWTKIPWRRYVSKDGNTAVFAHEITLNVGTGPDAIQMYFRFTVVLVFQDGKWLVVHWHGSKPEQVQSEEDTFGIEDLRKRNLVLEELVAERTAQLTKQKEELERALNDLKNTQAQLVHSEKMASLGELTAGIAHEIQNPLNFVNNFSEINNELIDELKTATTNLSLQQQELLNDIFQNNEKINHHGKRADGIVKSMLQHSSSKAGAAEPADINQLLDEYLRLSYHGIRAKDKSFNATLHTHFDATIGKVKIITQDIGRAFLNIINNAFFAVAEKEKKIGKDYKPEVSVTTKRLGSSVEIRISDNGGGIPNSVADQIFQPFFTTKPTGQGTGLGLSISYDIVTKGHGGTLKVETAENEGTTMVITLPIK